MTRPTLVLSLLATIAVGALACPLCVLEETEQVRAPGSAEIMGVGMQPGGPAGPPLDWRADEAGMLDEHVMLTDPERFSRAGEAYFDPMLEHVIFQATERPTPGEEASAHYAMYVAKLVKDDNGTITGIEEPVRVSPEGSANTCGFFHPTIRGAVIFGSTIVPPREDQEAGYQRQSSRYAWAFPKEMEVCWTVVADELKNQQLRDFSKSFLGIDLGWGGVGNTVTARFEGPAAERATPLFARPGGYDAECAFSPGGRHIVFSSIDPETGDADLWVYDVHRREPVKIVEAPGYDGGPFFSADGQRICYRSDREGNDLLQLFVADLVFDRTGSITGIAAEYQLTDNRHVNWGPYWHPSGEHLVYATSEVGHWNYEVFAIEVPAIGTEGAPGGAVIDFPDHDRGGLFEGLAQRRVTHASGFDGLPVYSNDGSYMIWTSQRGPKLEGEERPSSQVWVARVVDTAPQE